MSFPTGCWRKSPGLRVRPVAEWSSGVAYLPRPPRLVMIDLHAWLVLELCDGRPVDAVRRDYAAVVQTHGVADGADDRLAACLAELDRLGLIESVEAEASAAN